MTYNQTIVVRLFVQILRHFFSAPGNVIIYQDSLIPNHLPNDIFEIKIFSTIFLDTFLIDTKLIGTFTTRSFTQFYIMITLHVLGYCKLKDSDRKRTRTISTLATIQQAHTLKYAFITHEPSPVTVQKLGKFPQQTLVYFNFKLQNTCHWKICSQTCEYAYVMLIRKILFPYGVVTD